MIIFQKYSALDTLLEIGNGVTQEHIVEARCNLFDARDIIDTFVEDSKIE